MVSVTDVYLWDYVTRFWHHQVCVAVDKGFNHMVATHHDTMGNSVPRTCVTVYICCHKSSNRQQGATAKCYLSNQRHTTGLIIYNINSSWKLQNVLTVNIRSWYNWTIPPFGPQLRCSFIFHSFEAGIADAISSFKWRKIVLFVKNGLSQIEFFDWLSVHEELFCQSEWHFIWAQIYFKSYTVAECSSKPFNF